MAYDKDKAYARAKAFLPPTILPTYILKAYWAEEDNLKKEHKLKKYKNIKTKVLTRELCDQKQSVFDPISYLLHLYRRHDSLTSKEFSHRWLRAS